jgi:NTE family protein
MGFGLSCPLYAVPDRLEIVAKGEGKTALVLSAGGMFGAYQAGAWRALSNYLKPDLVVGASIGSLNGWAIAGGCDPEQWLQMWLSLTKGETLKYRLPRSPLDGVMDPAAFEDWVKEIYNAFTPATPFGVVLTEVPKMKPKLVRSPGVGWEHLAASCAVPGLLPMRRLHGSLYADGGTLNPLPLWAAAEMGATRIVAVNVLQHAPSSFQYAVRGLRALSRKVPEVPREIPVVTIAPLQVLGTLKDAFQWRREMAEAWTLAGERDAREKELLIRGML